MANPATVDDLVKRSLRPLSDAERAVGQEMLDDAWAIVLSQKPFVDEKQQEDVSFRRLVVQVLCAMVLRVLNNPNGKLEESGDDYSYRLDAAVSTGALYLSDAELALLGVGPGDSSGAFTIRPLGWGYPVPPDPWTPLGAAP